MPGAGPRDIPSLCGSVTRGDGLPFSEGRQTDLGVVREHTEKMAGMPVEGGKEKSALH